MADAELQACFGALATVTRLNVSGWPSSHEELQFLLRPGVVSGVAALTQLCTIHLGNRSIGMDSAVALRGALPTLQLLKQFSMKNCQCGKDLSEVMAGLRTVTGLENLDLSGNDLSQATAEVAEALRALPHLQTISLSNGGFETPAALGVVLGALHGTKGLLRVELSCDDPCSEDHAARLGALIDLIDASDSLRAVAIDLLGNIRYLDIEYLFMLGYLERLSQCLESVAMKDPLRLVQLWQVLDIFQNCC